MLHIQILAKTDDVDAAVLVQREQRMVSGHYGFSTAGEGTLENPVVWLVLYDLQSPARVDVMRKVREKYRDVRELFGVAREFSCEYSQ